METDRAVERARVLVEPAYRAVVQALPGSLDHIVGYRAGWWGVRGRPGGRAGKMLRPALACARAVDAEVAQAGAASVVRAAVAIEMVHDFSLLPDDVMDEGELRRGRPAAWRVFGRGPAGLAGDALLALALRQLASGEGELMGVLNQSLVRLCEGRRPSPRTAAGRTSWVAGWRSAFLSGLGRAWARAWVRHLEAPGEFGTEPTRRLGQGGIITSCFLI
ncbi:polyprenyl synthetase family protein [Nonomuraea endophytica]|uniref:polyprenyl synthetase family protein n=1 Tax=Nonomuraea endophytica TaxID=714136 RepID=UPI0037C71344